jgi:hypothetical protein
MNYVFDKNKKYKISIDRDGNELIYTATQVEITGTLLSFKDKFGQQFIFPVTSLTQATEME